MQFLNFQDKRWIVVSKLNIHHVNNPDNLKNTYKCDMIIKDKANYWILDQIIDAEFEDIK